MSEKLKGVYQKTLDKTYLGHWDVPEDGDLIVTIDHFEKNELKSGPTAAAEKKHICYFRDSKPMIVNKTNLKLLAKATGSDKFEDWEGETVALWAAPVPQADSGKGLRFREYLPKTETLICKECGEVIKDVMIDGKLLKAKVIANRAKTNYGKMMCFDCATAAKAEQEGDNE